MMRRIWTKLRHFRSGVFERYHQYLTQPHPPASLTWPRNPNATHVEIRWPRFYNSLEIAKWVEPVAGEMAKLVPLTRQDIPQRCVRAVEFQIVAGDRLFPAVLDFGDYPNEIEATALESALIYFKMQYRATGYGDTRVVPGGYVTPSEHIYHYIASLRAEQDRKPEIFDVYGRFGLRFAGDIRRRTVETLTNQNRFGYEGGLKLIRYSRYLKEIARSKICIDLPGNGDFCYRLVDYFAVGGCVIAARHGTRFPIPLVDREHIVYFADDGSDLLDLCDYYLTHADERRRLVENSRRYFDQYLHRAQLAGYYLHEIQARLPA